MTFRTVVKKLIPRQLFRLIEPYGHLFEAILLNVVYGFPARRLKIIGVTGTNGKTTTSFLIHRMLSESGYKVGLMTTVAYGVGDNIKPQVEHMTTVSVPVLLKRIKEMKGQGMDWLVLETTSHALAQHRVWGVPYSVAVLTNITHEHTDYHGTFRRYMEAKRKLFRMTNHHLSGLRTGVINADDECVNLFAKVIKHSLLYGVEHGELRARAVKTGPSGVSYRAEIGDDQYDIVCHIPGSFNVYNSLAAVGVGRTLGLSRQEIEQGIAALQSVEGRMTRVDAGQPFEVIVDFAHTPDSFEKLFKDLRPSVTGKLIVLFGSAGRRDEAKRPIQGELAGKYADEVIITEEDDRDIDGQQIMDEIAAGAEKSGKTKDKDLFLIHDRAKAIKFAIERAKAKDDVVLLLGKGHEKSIARAHGDDPWDEVAQAKRVLAEKNY
jgi:UDP-N-acetylmuramoyl-L-alanyl-D-glutamate--2,6-diaminopimelate ligase